jgi:hypothetical protein
VTPSLAMDATCCRLRGLAPERIKYLGSAGTMLGHVNLDKIEQVGETIAALQTRFAILPELRD